MKEFYILLTQVMALVALSYGWGFYRFWLKKKKIVEVVSSKREWNYPPLSPYNPVKGESDYEYATRIVTHLGWDPKVVLAEEE